MKYLEKEAFSVALGSKAYADNWEATFGPRREEPAMNTPCKTSPWTRGECDLGTTCCYEHRESERRVPAVLVARRGSAPPDTTGDMLKLLAVDRDAWKERALAAEKHAALVELVRDHLVPMVEMLDEANDPGDDLYVVMHQVREALPPRDGR